MEELNGALSLNNTMSIRELASAISTIEDLQIRPLEASKPINFREFLENKHYRTFDDIQSDLSLPEKKMSIMIPESDLQLSGLLVKLHQTLLNYYELSRAHAAGQIPISEVKYSEEQLQATQSFFDLETTSMAEKLPDSSTIINDLKRKGVTLNGRVISSDEHQAIEAFTRDRLDASHSRANRLFHFGGQFLEAILLQEFSHSMQLASRPDFILERGMVKGHIDWVRNPVNQVISGNINLKIFTCTSADPVNKDVPQTFFSIGSDGSSLITLDMKDIEKVIPRASDEVNRKTEGNIVPICEINGRIDIVFNQSLGIHYLKVREFSTKIYTPDLISTKAFVLKPVEEHAVETSPPMKPGIAALLSRMGKFSSPKTGKRDDAIDLPDCSTRESLKI